MMSRRTGITLPYLLLLPFVCAALSNSAVAQKSEIKWDVTKPRGQTREIDFTTSEGTWMSVDISPDGRWIVFDLLAHIYRVPAGGGQAECLTQGSGIALNFEPRYSPDGKEIAFVSDRNGQNNVWIMDADGTNPRLVHEEREGGIVEPVWTPDGQYIILRRLDYRSRDNFPLFPFSLWMYHRAGGEGVELLGPELRAAWPSVSPDGKYVYFHVATPTCPNSFRRRDVVQGCYQLRRLEFQTGRIEDVTVGETTQQYQRGTSGGAIAPEVSPDGHWLAFARRIPDGTISYKGHKFGPRTALWLRDLRTGAEHVLMDPIEVDLGEAIHTHRILPGYSWARDGKSIVLSQGGKIRRVDIESRKVDTIPFTAHVHRVISQIAYSPRAISDRPLEVRFMRWHRGSPDKSKLAFQAVGRIWLLELPDRAPRRLTSDSFQPLEYAPAWSPDGQWIAFTSWGEKEGGHVWKVGVPGGAPIRLTEEAGEYLNPAWSPDGKYLIVTRGSGETFRGRTWATNAWYELVRIPTSGGATEPVVRMNAPSDAPMGRGQVVQASFGANGRIFYPERRTQRKAGKEEPVTELISVKMDGSEKRVHLKFPYADAVAVAPNAKWVAFEEGDNVYLMPFPWMGTGATVPEIDKKKGRFPVKRLSYEGGLFPHWRDGTTLEFGSGNRYFTYQVETGKTETKQISLSVPGALPKSSIALTNARIITLDHRKFIEKGTVSINEGRIVCVGTCETKGIARVIDVRGKTIIPGFVDMHAHHHREEMGIIPPHDFETAIYLAYGVTTTLDPAGWSQNVFPTGEMIEAGLAIGPRIFSTGDPVARGDGPHHDEMTSYEVAEQEVKRRASWGAVSIKQYLQGRRDQRQWIVDAARKLGIMITAEGSIDLEHKISMAMDGYTGFEHATPYVPLYRDVAKFLGQAKVVYSPTFIVGGPGAWNEEYFFQESDLWKDEKQRRFLPWRWLLQHTRRRMLRPITDYSFPLLAQGLADIIAEGGYGAIGSHGQQHGIGSHWEVWMAASALGPLGALEVASLHGAHFLGMEKDLGSITMGKLADLMVLNSNPLENIRNTADILYVMKGGILYDASTLDEIWPEPKAFGGYYWVNSEALRSDDRPIDYWDHHRKE